MTSDVFRRSLIVGASIAALALGACNTVGIGKPVTPAPNVEYGVVASTYAFDVFARELAADFKATYPSLTASQRVAGKQLFAKLVYCPQGAGVTIDQCSGAVPLAHAAIRISDQASLTQQLALVASLIGQIKSTIHPGVTPVVPTVAELAKPAS